MYLSIFLAIFYGWTQQHYICTNMNGDECNSNENKLIAFLAITAYIVTPLVESIWFISWQEQENYDLTKELMIKVSELISTQYITIIKYTRQADRLKQLDDLKINIPNFSDLKHSYNVIY